MTFTVEELRLIAIAIAQSKWGTRRDVFARLYQKVSAEIEAQS